MLDLLLIMTAFGGGFGCLIMHPGWGRLVGLVGPVIAFVNVQLNGMDAATEGTWTYLGVNLVAAIAGGWAFGHGRIAKLRALADADD